MAAKILTQAVSTISTGGAPCRPAATPSKRAFLRGAVAAAAASIPAGTLASDSNPDAALLALQPEIDAADMAWEAGSRERNAVEKVYFALKPDKPEQAERESGLTAAEEAQNAAADVRLSLSDVVVTIRATTLAGLIFKARFAASHFPGDPDEDVMRSIVEDLLAMPGESSDG
jgi:hypothetical protein